MMSSVFTHHFLSMTNPNAWNCTVPQMNLMKWLNPHSHYSFWCNLFYINVLLLSSCWSPQLFNGSFSFNRNLSASFKCNWTADDTYAVLFSCFYRYCWTESAGRGGAGGVSHGVHRAPLQVHWRRWPNKTHTGTEAVCYNSVAQKCQIVSNSV